MARGTQAILSADPPAASVPQCLKILSHPRRDRPARTHVRVLGRVQPSRRKPVQGLGSTARQIVRRGDIDSQARDAGSPRLFAGARSCTDAVLVGICWICGVTLRGVRPVGQTTGGEGDSPVAPRGLLRNSISPCWLLSCRESGALAQSGVYPYALACSKRKTDSPGTLILYPEARIPPWV